MNHFKQKMWLRLALVLFCAANLAVSLAARADQPAGQSLPSSPVSSPAVESASGSGYPGSPPVGSVGVGLMLGEPTGLSAVYLPSVYTAIDAALAYSFIRQEDFQIHADYLLRDYALVDGQDPNVDFYWGGGLRLKFESSARFGVRVPTGVTYQFGKRPLQAFGELVPILDFAPNLSVSINASVGIRYFF